MRFLPFDYLTLTADAAVVDGWGTSKQRMCLDYRSSFLEPPVTGTAVAAADDDDDDDDASIFQSRFSTTRRTAVERVLFNPALLFVEVKRFCAMLTLCGRVWHVPKIRPKRRGGGR